ncbi:butyryl-CoA:acetate CoA-transferase [Anaerosphaera multitolerans]|uniref:Butyryl-CoA:acetate CoA-transferase n=1 Tax=Anaerosphaera multitolerans TaxID=2487351 RepID=A0A437S6F2_9FIRM|nr:butyryl-CoA:acetate CoA-transferase [Anaerosphaera multitolerans]RVU54582.1 butyryl-CoA:acetate CoA-transferase [Anaerosphaera multitolerans]
MDYKNEYNEKLITAEKAASFVKSGDYVDYGWAGQTPVAIDKELAKRAGELKDVIVRGGVLLAVPEIFKADPNGDSFVWFSWHAGGPDRGRINNTDGGFYIPLRYSELPRLYRENSKVDIAYLVVAPMDKHGYFNMGLNASHLMAVIETADKVIVEVNENLPIALGGFENEVHISDVDFVVEGDNPPMAELPAGSFGEVDKKVAEIIVNEIPNGACIQLGIGGMPNAVGSLIAESDLKDLGVHTEMFVDAFVDLYNAGKVNGSRKNIDRFRQTYAFAAGTKKLYDFIDNNPQCMAAPVDYTNDARIISKLDNFVSINNAVNVDLVGQVSSESSGFKHISGAGGQLDFVLGAYLSEGGKSFICLSSTFFNKKTNQEESRIVPNFETGSAITVPRPITNYIVTEHGMFNAKGKSNWERAEGIINIAAPQFRDELIKEAEKIGIWRNSNKR